MKRRLHEFVEELRRAGLRISTAESLDAMRAAAVVGVERGRLREALAATLVKDEADRPRFDAVFARFFAVPPPARRKKKTSTAAGEDGGGGSAEGRGRTVTPEPPEADEFRPGQRAGESSRAARTGRSPAVARMAREAELRERPFAEWDDRDRDACPDLAAALARRFRHFARRRLQSAPRGRLDLRRSLRRAASSGGVPLDLAWQRPRPRRPDLVVLCDLSHSTAHASEFLLSLLLPCERYFRRVRRFGYVDLSVEISLEGRRLVPHAPIDLHARSDFGRVLVGLDALPPSLLNRGTVLLVLGDARNNRRPPHLARLAALRRRVKRLVWLNPEDRRRWDSGDSVLSLYAPHCDLVLTAGTPRQLERALEAALRRNIA